MSVEITRCGNCAGQCNEHFVSTAVELLTSDDGTTQALETGENKERLLRYRLQEIIGCTLTRSEITTNLEGLMEGTLKINGRQEI
jgi:hypothetical protein